MDDSQPFPNNLQPSDFPYTYPACWLLSAADRENGPPIHNEQSSYNNQTKCFDCAWSADSKLFAWSCGKRMVKIIDTNTDGNGPIAEPYREGGVEIDARQIVTSVAFGSSIGKSRDGIRTGQYRTFHWEDYDTILAVGLRNGRIRIIDVHSGQILLELVDHTDSVTQLKFAPDKSLVLASSSADGTVKFWELDDDGNMMRTLHITTALKSPGKKAVCKFACWSPNAKTIAAVGNFKEVLIFDVKTGKPIHKFFGHQNNVTCCDFSPDGTLLLTASDDSTAVVWNMYTGDMIAKFRHQFPAPSEWFPRDDDTSVTACKFSQDVLSFTTIASDGYVRFWQMDTDSLHKPVSIFSIDTPTCSNYSNDDRYIAVGNGSGSVAILPAHKKCQSLSHLCRLIVNKLVTLNQETYDSLNIGSVYKAYLQYDSV